MESNRWIRKRLNIAGASLSILLLSTFVYAGQKEVLYTWPTQPRPPLQASIEIVNFDGMSFQQLVLRGEGLKLIMPPFNNWKIANATTRESIKFEYPNIETLSLSISLFKKNTFLPNLEDETLTGYVSGLYSQNLNRIHILNEGDYSPYKSFPIAGTNYKFIEYEINDPEKGPLLMRDYLLMPDDKLMIIHLEGPPNAVRRVSPTLDASLQQSFIED